MYKINTMEISKKMIKIRMKMEMRKIQRRRLIQIMKIKNTNNRVIMSYYKI